MTLTIIIEDILVGPWTLPQRALEISDKNLKNNLQENHRIYAR